MIKSFVVLVLVLVSLVTFASGQKCMQGTLILEKYPDASLCEPYLNSTQLFFQDATYIRYKLELYTHAAMSGIAAGISGTECKNAGLNFFCQAVFSKCVKHKLIQAPWPGLVMLPSLPCYDTCLKAQHECKDTMLTIDCTPFESNELVIAELNTTVYCNDQRDDDYTDIILTCPDSLAYSDIYDNCQLPCVGTDYPDAARYGLIITSGWIMLFVAINCVYLLPPLFHKAISEPFFRTRQLRGSNSRMVSGKLSFLFVLNLFIYTFSWTPYIIVPGSWIWCTGNVFGRSRDNINVAIMGFISVSSNMTYRGYWFLLLIDIWTTIFLGRTAVGGPILWTVLMIIPFLWGYPPMIYAWVSNNITTVPSVHTIAYVVDTYVKYLKMSIVDIPLTVVSVASIPFVFHLFYLLYKMYKNDKIVKRVDFEQYTKMSIWYAIYLIPALMVVIFFWNLRAKDSAIAEGYTNYITCTIANIDTSSCYNTGLQSVTWLVFIGIFGLMTLTPVGYILGVGRKNAIFMWWKTLLIKRIVPDAPGVKSSGSKSSTGGSGTGNSGPNSNGSNSGSQ